MRFIHGHQNIGRVMPQAHRDAIRVATTTLTPGRALLEGWWKPNISGLCKCGCGGKAPLAQQTSRRSGTVKGYPTRRLNGHQTRGHKMPPKSAEARANLSAALRGKPKPPGFGAKLSAIHKGRKMPPRTPEHLAKISAALTGSNYGRVGEKAAHWKGGITPIHLALRATPEYKQWRTSVFERDAYTCQHCGGSSGLTLHAHHIKPFATHPELRTVLENGVTLCQTCHKAIPRRSTKETT